MTAAVLPAELSAAPRFGPAHLMLERAEKLFRRPRYPIAHSLRICSDVSLIEFSPQGKQTRFVPCIWGVRRDDYRWKTSHGGEGFAALRSGAAAMGWVMVHVPLAGWEELLPGTMAHLMGTESSLHLADYWMLTLHHLVWCKRLPYPLRSRWVRGTSVHDQAFDFLSELPTSVAEASLDALILFREAAGRCGGGSEPVTERAPASILPVEPPICRDGRWSVAVQEAPRTFGPSDEPPPGGGGQTGLAAVAKESASPASLPLEPPVSTNSASVLELDDQSFTVRFGGSAYRFAPRNKQLFALLDRINRRPGHRVSFDDLRSVGDVWDGLNVEDSTIRGAVARLRKVLKEHGMQALAGRMATGTYRGSAYIVLRMEDEPSNTE